MWSILPDNILNASQKRTIQTKSKERRQASVDMFEKDVFPKET